MTSGPIENARLFLDANVLIPMIEQSNPYADRLRGLFDPWLPDPSFRIVTSELVLAECMVGPLRTGQRAFRELYELIREEDIVELVSVSWDVVVTAASLRARHRELKMPDSIHLASAMLSGCDSFLTDDARLKPTYGAHDLMRFDRDGSPEALEIRVVSPADPVFDPYLGPRS